MARIIDNFITVITMLCRRRRHLPLPAAASFRMVRLVRNSLVNFTSDSECAVLWCLYYPCLGDTLVIT